MRSSAFASCAWALTYISLPVVVERDVVVVPDYLLPEPQPNSNKFFGLEGFSYDCGKTATKLIIPTSHIRENRAMNQSECLAITCHLFKVREKSRTGCDWFLFCFSLIEKLAWDFEANKITSETIVIAGYFGQSFEIALNVQYMTPNFFPRVFHFPIKKIWERS